MSTCSRAVPLALALAACGCGPARYPLPDRVTVSMVEATVAPFDEKGRDWDGGGPVAAQLVSGLTSAMAGGGKRKEGEKKAAAVIGFVAQAAARGISAPDPKGWAEVQYPGAPPARVRLSETSNSLRPHFANARWTGVVLHDDTRLRIHLEDDDPIGSNELIGTAELNYDDLVDALESQKIWQVAVADQTHNQLLYVGISVTGE
jgi:hypothetical protein